MTVIVTLREGGIDKYLRSGDKFVKHNDGTLNVVRGGAKQPYSYPPGAWTEVTGDEKSRRRSRLWG